ncbi:MAG TPA: D-glycerate dehydrogenase, partial [Bacillota bacterium]|nr:D-glycerate dehydrogenase [Bacillota bacterium]
MVKKKVLVTRRLPDEALRLLDDTCEVELNPYDRVMTRDELIEGIRDKEGILCLLTDTITAEVMDAAVHLKVISNYAVGFDNVDVKAATGRGIVVTNTPGVLTETSADLTWALLMATARRIVEADAFMRNGKYTGWGPMMLLGGDVYGKTLGLVGMGRIGCAVARRAAGFNMRVLYYDVNRLSEDEEKALNLEYSGFDELLKEADFVSLHVPLLPSTRHLVGARELSLMKPTSYLINTSRGPVVDEKALVEALRSGKIAGAGLDVYENEPEMAPGLPELENVVLLPHIASASVETRTKMGIMAAQ